MSINCYLYCEAINKAQLKLTLELAGYTSIQSILLLHEAMSKGHNSLNQLMHDILLELVRCKDTQSKPVSSGHCKPDIP